METLIRPTEERIVLYDISWETYERLLAELEESGAFRLTFDQGTLEIMSPLQEHEETNRTLALLVEVIAEERRVSVRNIGSTTLKRQDMARGFEPDSCFYIQNAGRIRGKARVDLAVDPPPDLVIEIDITSPSLSKLPIYARLGVPEVWRYVGGVLTILILESGTYREAEESTAFPGIDRATLSALLEDGQTLERVEWLQKVREWVRRRGGG